MRKVYNLPPGWPTPPKDWSPEPDRTPEGQWTKPPGWELWVDVPDTALLGEGAVVMDVSDEELGTRKRRRTVRLAGLCAAAVVVFLVGIGLGAGDGGEAEIAEARATASAAVVDAETAREAAEAEQATLAEAQAAVEADRAALAEDQEELDTRTAKVAKQEKTLSSRESAVETAEAKVSTREADVADREKAVEADAAAGIAAPATEEDTTEDPPAADTGSASYENCDAARAAGAAPVYVGDPGYGSHLDRDGDGVGCE